MTRLADATTFPREDRGASQRGACLLGVGTAVPEFCMSQEESADRLARIWNLHGAALDRWRRIVAGSGIAKRQGVLPPEEVVGLSTGQRMAVYERMAPAIAEQAAREALQAAALTPSQITDLVVVSCTGFSAPGLDVTLIERLGLPVMTRRTTIGFMGCFGAINGLRVANGLCAATHETVVLLVCAELCSLHMRREPDVQNQVASALFADGAAAAVLGNARNRDNETLRRRDEAVMTHLDTASPRLSVSPALSHIGQTSSLLLPEGREWMTWRITDAGFAMTLTRDVPAALRASIGDFLRNLGAPTDAAFIVHPGGPGVLDAVDDALELRGSRGLECSRRILRDYGNMSSGTVLFVLQESLRAGHVPPAVMLAFGPGLTIEGLVVEKSNNFRD